MLKHKKVITYLLLAACSLCGVILFTSKTSASRSVSTPEALDSLVQELVIQYEPDINRIRRTSVTADSTFSRKITYLYTPPSFSKTTFHHEMQNRLSPFQIDLPARVTFPDKDMDIHLIHQGTIWHTVRLLTEEPKKN